MILADASVWIDHLGGVATREAAQLDRLLGKRLIGIADVTICEVLQGIRDDARFERTRLRFGLLPVVETGGASTALQAARNYRFLRARGITVRKTIDTLIATRCIIDGHALLFSDRDFEPFVAHLGLVDAMRVTS